MKDVADIEQAASGEPSVAADTPPGRMPLAQPSPARLAAAINSDGSSCHWTPYIKRARAGQGLSDDEISEDIEAQWLELLPSVVVRTGDDGVVSVVVERAAP